MAPEHSAPADDFDRLLGYLKLTSTEIAALRELRGKMNVLAPGDVVFIPEKEEKEESRGVESKHTFKRKGVPAQLKLQFLDAEGEPRAGVPYEVRDGVNVIDRAEPDAYDLTRTVMSANAVDPVAQEGIDAFLAKRPPAWPDP